MITSHGYPLVFEPLIKEQSTNCYIMDGIWHLQRHYWAREVEAWCGKRFPTWGNQPGLGDASHKACVACTTVMLLSQR